uniref:Cytochrome P450 n=1 Tax=Aplanochytrium stocchinoi TaxID=215587 RepID=A0A7S3PFH7_9STRA
MKEKRQKATKPEESILSYWINYKPMLSDDEIYNLCMTFLTMGHENVATAISWFIITLAENPDVQDEIREELKPSNDRNPTPKSTKLVSSFYETMRLFPSVPALTRMSTKENIVNGYKIPPGYEVFVPIYSTNRDQEVWGEDNEDFNPSRFKDQNKCPYFSTKGLPDAISFGVGARACLGRPLSMVEMKATITTLLLKYQISSKRSEKTKANNFVSLRPGKHEISFTPIPSVAKM